MAVIEYVRFFFVIMFLLSGMSIFFLEIFGVFRFRYLLNRMQIAAMGDTLGISLCITGLMIANGFNFTTAKMVLVIIFLWFASPVSSHMISKLEYITGEKIEEHCRILDIEDLNQEGTDIRETDLEIDKIEQANIEKTDSRGKGQ